MTPTQFRYTLAAYIVLGIIGGSFDLVFPSAIPEALSNAQETNDANLSTTSLILVALLGIVVIVGGITSFVGLYLFRPWSPRLAVIVTVLTLFVWPLEPPRVLRRLLFPREWSHDEETQDEQIFP
jgi:ABC-type multidrug transport system fused ATPase/permease subunit